MTWGNNPVTIFLTIGALALGLAMDAFAVALSQGTVVRQRAMRHALALGAAFGGAQAAMPLLGALLGAAILGWIAAFDHWVVLGLLGFLGYRMIAQAFDDETEASPLTGWALGAAAIATSIDALAAGIALPSLGLPVLSSALVIGLVTAILCIIGVRFGAALGSRAGRAADVLGGLILIGIGFNTFISHQFFGA